MAKFSYPRPGRPTRAMVDAKLAEQAAIDAPDNDVIGKTQSSGPETPTEPDRESQRGIERRKMINLANLYNLNRKG